MKTLILSEQHLSNILLKASRLPRHDLVLTIVAELLRDIPDVADWTDLHINVEPNLKMRSLEFRARVSKEI
jgi:hypothetical protein